MAVDDPLAIKKKRKTSPQKPAKSKKMKSKKKFECPEVGCKYSCVLAKTLKTHRRKHEKSEAVDMAGVEIRVEKCARKGGKLLYKCSRCQTAFLKRASVEAHIASVHMDVKRYTCNACGRGFHRSRDLEEHTRTHTGERPFGCPMEGCDYSSSWCTTVYRHVRRHHKHYTGELTPKAVTKARPLPTKESDGVKANVVENHKEKPREVSVTIEANPDAASVEHITDLMDADDDEKLSPYEEININDNSGAQYTCNICSVDFEQLLAIKRHIHKDHADVKKRSCNLCGIALSNAHNLTPHMRIHTGERPFKCGSCEQDFVTVSDLRRHGRRFNHTHDHLMRKWCKCIVCRKSFHSIQELEDHVVEHIEDSDALKAEASKKMTIYEAVKITINSTSVDSDETYICNICNKEISTLSLAKGHVVKQHKEVKRLSCVYCGFTADTRSALSTHVRTHSESIAFKCSHILCNHSTKLFGDHQRHIRNCTKAKDIEILDAMFSQSEGAKRGAPLTRFERANISTNTEDQSGKTQLKCAICQAEFDQLGTTREHLKLKHAQIHRYGCPHCESTFLNAHSLAQHMAEHKEAQPLRRCPVEGCHFTMVTDEDQKKHQRWHEKKTNPRPKRFVCEVCGKNFEIKGSLLRHMSKKHKTQK
ncbi:zinc finger protein Xfin-like isoform X2 [Armigeres subalbatus]